MTTTDFKPGDIVRHPTWGNGVAAYTKFGLRVIGTSDGYECIFGFTGWERAETVRPGHVQVRVDDLDDCPSEWLKEDEDAWGFMGRIAIRAAKAIAAQRAETTPPADEPERAEKPTSTTVTLPCPKCGEEIVNQVVVRLDSDTLNGGYYLAFDGEYPVTNHRCQPDEPQGFGARVTVTLPDGVREKWLRQPSRWWVSEWGGESMWRYLIERGTVTLGWESE